MKAPDHNIHHAARILQHGGIIAYPTEAVYGLGCLPDNLPAIQRLLQLKQRPATKGLILLASEIQQLEPYMADLKPDILDKILSSWPGPVTWVVPAAQNTSPLIRGHFTTVAVRISAHPIVRELCSHCQSAIISTSANISGKQMTYNVLDVHLQFNNKLDYILSGALGDSNKPSIIKDALSDQLIRS